MSPLFPLSRILTGPDELQALVWPPPLSTSHFGIHYSFMRLVLSPPVSPPHVPASTTTFQAQTSSWGSTGLLISLYLASRHLPQLFWGLYGLLPFLHLAFRHSTQPFKPRRAPRARLAFLISLAISRSDIHNHFTSPLSHPCLQSIIQNLRQDDRWDRWILGHWYVLHSPLPSLEPQYCPESGSSSISIFQLHFGIFKSPDKSLKLVLASSFLHLTFQHLRQATALRG